jgi:hypothetical protein
MEAVHIRSILPMPFIHLALGTQSILISLRLVGELLADAALIDLFLLSLLLLRVISPSVSLVLPHQQVCPVSLLLGMRDIDITRWEMRQLRKQRKQVDTHGILEAGYRRENPPATPERVPSGNRKEVPRRLGRGRTERRAMPATEKTTIPAVWNMLVSFFNTCGHIDRCVLSPTAPSASS